MDEYREHIQRTTGQVYDIRERSGTQMTTLYLDVVDDKIKPHLPGFVNRYKMASVAELTIVEFQPLFDVDEVKCRAINAGFAMYAAIGVINSFPPGGFMPPPLSDTSEHAYRVRKMFKDHQAWLFARRDGNFPIFANAAFLEALHVACGCFGKEQGYVPPKEEVERR